MEWGRETGWFRREDEGPDEAFYASPRLVVHVDDAAVAAIGRLFRRHLPAGGDVLDLMSSWRSHLPADLALGRVAGLGLNAVELAENPRLTERVVHDLNQDPALPFPEASFDGAVVTVSVQYLTRPVEVVQEVGRVLRPEAPFLVVFSNRMFPTKAVAVWRALDDRGRSELIAEYFRRSGTFDASTPEDWSPRGHDASDPVYLVWARRRATSDVEGGGGSRL